MSGVPEVCPVCNEAAVIVDIVNDKECNVCVECGTVVQEHGLSTQLVSNEGYQDAKDVHKNAYQHLKHVHKNYEPQGLIEGRRRIKKVSNMFTFSPVLVTAAINLYEKAYNTRKFKQVTISNKLILSDCCVFIAGRQNQEEMPLTMKEFCRITKESVFPFASLYKELISLFHIDLPHQSVGVLIGYYMSKAGFKRNICDLVTDIAYVCQDNLLTSSCYRYDLVVSAAYFAWTSENISENQGKIITLKEFTTKFKFPYSRALQNRMKEIKKKLTEIGERLPWISDVSGKDFVQSNLKDILKYNKSLIYERLKVRMAEEETEVAKSLEEVQCKGDACNRSVGNEGSTSRETARKRTSDDKKCTKQKSPSKKIRLEGELSDDSDTSDTERLSYEVDENLSSYIRDEKEVELLIKSGFLA